MTGLGLAHGLATFGRLPSWCNRAGRTDRCACDNLDAPRLWRRVTHWNHAGRGDITITHDQLPALRRLRHLRGHDRVRRCRVTRQTHLRSLHLPEHWTQDLACRRQRLHDRLTRHWLVCPLCDRGVVMLFMPRCTFAEHVDATIALEYLQRRDLPREDRRRLLAYYFWLLPPRRFVCRHCLGMRYGDVKNPALFGSGALDAERNPRRDIRPDPLLEQLHRTLIRQFEDLLPMLRRVVQSHEPRHAAFARSIRTVLHL